MSKTRGYCLATLAISLAGQANAQTATSLDTVRVTVTRDTARSPLTLPFALTSIRPDTVRPGQKRSSLDEFLLVVPGVFSANRQNPSQDPRISIRGFGSRSTFGVRGVRVLWDGIPLTVADGQTPVDYIDLGVVDRVEVIRGSASALYGNSSGGVISLSTLRDSTSRMKVGQSYESVGARRSSLQLAGAPHGLAANLSVNRASGSGFRDYSEVLATRVSAVLSHMISRNAWTLHLSSLDMPRADNPGSLTSLQMKTDPSLADPLSVRKKAGKGVDQRQVGLSTSGAFAGANYFALVYGAARRLDNPLTFATVHLNRSSGGLSLRASGPLALAGLTTSLSSGIDVQLQNDDRHEVENCADTPMPSVSVRCPVSGQLTGAMRKNQREVVSSVGAYVKSELQSGSRTTMTIAARRDLVKFRVDDRMPVAAVLDQSGSRSMSATSPMIGVVYRAAPLMSVYANASGSFETPTATELANNTDGTTGLNKTLRPQLSRTLEAGIKGFANTLQYDFAVYLTGVRDELIPFEIPNGAGRRFFRNAGKTRRSGFESSLEGKTGIINWSVAYTSSRFVFRDYVVGTTDYSSNRIPGIPPSRLDAAVTIRQGRSFFTGEGTWASRTFVDDLNTEKAPGYHLLNLRAGTIIPFRTVSVRPVLGVSNLLNQAYSASVSINAAGGKYYEPGSRRLLYGMVQIESRF